MPTIHSFLCRSYKSYTHSPIPIPAISKGNSRRSKCAASRRKMALRVATLRHSNARSTSHCLRKSAGHSILYTCMHGAQFIHNSGVGVEYECSLGHSSVITQHKFTEKSKDPDSDHTRQQLHRLIYQFPSISSVCLTHKRLQNGSPEDVRNEQPARVVVCCGAERPTRLVQSSATTLQRELQKHGV